MVNEVLPITNAKLTKELIVPEINRIEPPERLDEHSVIYWSRHYRAILGAPKGKARASKARLFIQKKCIRYDKEMGVFYCDPIKGYNKSIYTIRNKKSGGFECSCQFYEKVCRDTDFICSHILGVYLWLRIHNWNKGHRGEEDIVGIVDGEEQKGMSSFGLQINEYLHKGEQE